MGKSQHLDSSVIYGRSYGMIFLCKPCDAYVGCHKSDQQKALGRLANSELREAKKLAHYYFDKLWKDKHMKRGRAYRWLSDFMGIELEYCHIGMFDVKECMEVVFASKKYLNQL